MYAVSAAAAQLREAKPHLSELTALLGSSPSSGTGGRTALGRAAGSRVVEGLKEVGRSIKQAATAAAPEELLQQGTAWRQRPPTWPSVCKPAELRASALQLSYPSVFVSPTGSPVLGTRK